MGLKNLHIAPGLNLRITPELLRKARARKTPEELRALAEEEGYELTQEQLESIAGGGWSGGAGVYVECWYCGERISPDEDWCPECGMWLGEGPEPDFAPAREDHEIGIRTKG